MKSASPFTRKNTITIYLHKLFCLRLERKKRFRLSRCITPLRGCGCTNTPHGGTEPPYGVNKQKKCLLHYGRIPHLWVYYAMQIYKHFYKKQVSPQKLTIKIIQCSISYIYTITIHHHPHLKSIFLKLWSEGLHWRVESA